MVKKQAILSVFGSDRVGIAHDLAETLGHRDLDIETSRMTSLRGRFAVLMAISGAPSSITNLRLNLSTLSTDLGFDLRLDPVETVGREKAAPRIARGTGRDMLIESFSAEPSGLNSVTEVLKRRCINVEELETDASSAPFSGELTFYMRARVEVPDSCSVDRLGEELRELKQRRDVDVVVKRGCEIPGALVPEEVG
jgi:glycine cleavage system regulatory protein